MQVFTVICMVLVGAHVLRITTIYLCKCLRLFVWCLLEQLLATYSGRKQKTHFSSQNHKLEMILNSVQQYITYTNSVKGTLTFPEKQ